MKTRAYADPYLAGVVLGLVLLACFVLTGQGLGASGAFADLAAHTAALANREAVARNGYLGAYLSEGAPWTVWMVVEVAGVLAGGFLSAWLSGRLRRGPEATTGPALPPSRGRVAAALGGGALMGVGAVLARGCTSGQALSGGAMLSVGSWLFMGALFASAFLAAPLVRRLWA